MNSIITMSNGNRYQAFRIFEDGTASMDLGSSIQKISDFAEFFIVLYERGWRKITETEFLMPKVKAAHKEIVRKGESRKGMLRQLNGFRQDWYAYMGDRGNVEEFDFCT